MVWGIVNDRVVDRERSQQELSRYTGDNCRIVIHSHLKYCAITLTTIATSALVSRYNAINRDMIAAIFTRALLYIRVQINPKLYVQFVPEGIIIVGNNYMYD